MGGYADYALATRVPALWAQMQRDQAQKRTGDLAKNMFAQLQGLDPQSKEYFQRMRQLGMESGDDTLYQTGEGLNKAQQGYVFDDPMLTGHWKDFLLEGGDPNDKNAFSAWNERRASQSGTNVNVNLPGQAGFDWNAPVPLKDLKEYTPGNKPFYPGMTYAELRSSGAVNPGENKPVDQAKAAGYSTLLANELMNAKNLIDTSGDAVNNKSRIWSDASLETGARIAPVPFAPIVRSYQSNFKQNMEPINASLRTAITYISTGASATEDQMKDFARAYEFVDGEPDNVRAQKVRRVGELQRTQNLLGNNLRPEMANDGRIVLGTRTGDDGSTFSYVMERNGDIKIMKKR